MARKIKEERYQFYRYHNLCDIDHRVVVIGLGSCGVKAIEALLEMGVDPVDIVAVDAFNENRWGSRSVFFELHEKLKMSFPDEIGSAPGITAVPETGTAITNPITDDLAYVPAAACEIAIIALDAPGVDNLEAYAQRRYQDMIAAKEMVTLARLHIPVIFVADRDNLNLIMDQIQVLLEKEYAAEKVRTEKVAKLLEQQKQ
ncbi:MAG TPA: hypothetical protein DEA43_03510 [Candidatus Moranbacteria bacterium]|nr:hypothetical protein [Candidatus Moranbacteria bacterium]HBT45923.1 hypothetical protein [Candidatus Moranbacteria bacterium]